MKRILYGIVGVIMAMPSFAVDDPIVGDKTTTSQPYVYNQIEKTQVKIPAANPSNTNIGSTVVTYTNVAGGGTIGERGLFTGGTYDASNDADKLITASALNNTFTNLPTTDTTTLQCANQDCTLWTIVDQTAYGETITLPAGYTRLEYIQSTGTQYIDTGIKQQDGDEFGLVYQQITLDTSYRSLFGASVSGTAGSLYISQTSSDTWVGNVRVTSLRPNTNKHTLSWTVSTSSDQSIVIDEINYNVAIQIIPNADLSVKVFARNETQSKMIGKVYGYYQKRNGEYLINLVPAKNSNNVIGLYDTVSGQFFTNQGSGDFIAGPVVN